MGRDSPPSHEVWSVDTVDVSPLEQRLEHWEGLFNISLQASRTLMKALDAEMTLGLELHKHEPTRDFEQ